MKILLVSATSSEIAPTRAWLKDICHSPTPVRHQRGEMLVDVLISGVGMAITGFSLGTVLAKESYDLCIQAGIGGALDKDLKLGQVVEVISERFADLGAEDKDGSFLDLNTLGLQEKESGIFTSEGKILNLSAMNAATGLQKVNAYSINSASGSESTINNILSLYPEAQVESMEGAAFFYACRANEVAMLQLRSISNYVTPRDRSAWVIPDAVQNLNKTLISLLTAFFKQAED